MAVYDASHERFADIRLSIPLLPLLTHTDVFINIIFTIVKQGVAKDLNLPPTLQRQLTV